MRLMKFVLVSILMAACLCFASTAYALDQKFDTTGASFSNTMTMYYLDGSTGKIGLIGANAVTNNIPDMTSNTAPSGVASSNGEGLGTFAYQAFDQDATTLWISDTINTGYLQYAFDVGVAIVPYRYVLTSTNSGNYVRSPKDFTLIGANDVGMVNGVILDTQTGLVWTQGEIKTFTIAASCTFRYFRIDITETQDDSVQPGIAEWEMFGGFDTGSPDVTFTQLNLGDGVAQTLQYSDILLTSSDIVSYGNIQGALAIDGGGYSAWVSLNSPTGVPSADGIYSFQDAGTALNATTFDLKVRLISNGTQARSFETPWVNGVTGGGGTGTQKVYMGGS